MKLFKAILYNALSVCLAIFTFSGVSLAADSGCAHSSSQSFDGCVYTTIYSTCWGTITYPDGAEEEFYYKGNTFVSEDCGPFA